MIPTRNNTRLYATLHGYVPLRAYYVQRVKYAAEMRVAFMRVPH